MKKQIISFFVAVLVALSVFPAAAFAAEEPEGMPSAEPSAEATPIPEGTEEPATPGSTPEPEPAEPGAGEEDPAPEVGDEEDNGEEDILPDEDETPLVEEAPEAVEEIPIEAAAVTGLQAKRASYKSISLTWNADPLAESYMVFRSTNQTGGYVKIRRIAKGVTSYVDDGLVSETTYYYKVATIRGGRTAEVSQPVSAKTTLKALTTVKVRSLNYKTLRITWEKVGGATGYEIFRSTKKESGYKRIARTGDTNVFDSKSLWFGATYYYKIRPVRDGKLGPLYGPVSGKTTLSKVEGLKTVGINPASIRLTWNQVPGSTRYVVYRSQTKGSGYTELCRLGSNTCTDRSVQAGKEYYYKVRPLRDAFRGEVSGALKGKAALELVTGLAVRTGTDGDLHVSWNAVPGADSYAVYRSTVGPYPASYTSEFILHTKIPETSFVDKALHSGKTYTYKIAPCYGSYTEKTNGVVSGSPQIAPRVQAFINALYAELGKPYVLGGKGPAVFDCSGLIYYAGRQSGNALPYMTSHTWGSSSYPTITNYYDLKPGDILWRQGHVAVFIGDHTIIEAVGVGVRVAYIEDFNNSRFVYGKRRF
jgi:cell wall-associated NlpC family hydrolase